MAEAEGSRTRKPRATRAPTRFDRISGWLTLAANLGVLGGIVLVILQLDQNEKMMRAQTRHEIAIGIADLLADTASNPQLSEILVRNNAGGELTPVEQHQVQMRLGALVRLWEDEHYQYRMGLYDRAEFVHERNNWKDVLRSNRGVLTFWCGNKENFSAEFATEMNSLLEPGACEPVQR